MSHKLIVSAAAALFAAALFATGSAFAAETKVAAKEPKSSGDVREGQPAPEFELPDQDGRSVKLSELTGKWVLLYFYPKDDTPGCTAEAKGFRDEHPDFKLAGVQVLGVSVDDVQSHERFAEKHGLPFPILADDQKKVVKAYGVAGTLLPWASRTSFLIDPQGNVAKIYDKVSPAAHAKEVLADVALLKSRRIP